MVSSERVRRWPGYSAVWRWHFYAGLFCIPFILWLAGTGMIYLWRPQIEALLDRPFAEVTTSSARVSPSAIARAAERAVPGVVLHRYQLPDTPRQAVQVIVGRGTRETRVYVNPATGAVLKTVDEDGRLMPIVFALHGELLLGSAGSYLVELAASWAIVMIVSGLFLWWPRGRGMAGLVYPRLWLRGRAFWRDVHAVTGLWVSLLTLGFLLSGLPWAASWGSYLQAIRAIAAPASSTRDWTLGQDEALAQRAAADAAVRRVGAPHAGHHAMPMRAMPDDLSPLDRLVPAATALDLARPALIAPPQHAGAPWTASSNAQNRPLRAMVELDPSGRVRARHVFTDRPLLDRIIDYGVATHEGQLFGIANQLLNSVVAIGLVMLAISGAAMWWRRRPADTLGAPPARAVPPVTVGFVALLVLLGIALPMLGVSMIVVLLAERLLLRRIPFVSRWLGLRAAAA